MVIAGSRSLVITPGGFLHPRKYDAGIRSLWLLLGPYVPITIVRLRIATRFLEPEVFIGGVVDHQVDEHAHPALLAALGKLDEIAQRAVSRIDTIVVGNVVSIILTRRRVKRHKPQCGHAHALQIVETTHQTLEVPDAIAICIHVCADRHAIDDCVLVPEVIDHSISLSFQRMSAGA